MPHDVMWKYVIIGDGLRDALDLRIRGRFFSILFTNGYARLGVKALQEASSPLPVEEFGEPRLNRYGPPFNRTGPDPFEGS